MAIPFATISGSLRKVESAFTCTSSGFLVARSITFTVFPGRSTAVTVAATLRNDPENSSSAS
jgi:hypothetical protein